MTNELIASISVPALLSVALVWWVKSSLAKLDKIPVLISLAKGNEEKIKALSAKIDETGEHLKLLATAVTKVESRLDHILERLAEKTHENRTILSKLESMREEQIIAGQKVNAAWREIEKMRDCDR